VNVRVFEMYAVAIKTNPTQENLKVKASGVASTGVIGISIQLRLICESTISKSW
jgi:hypothetical protein